MVSVGLGGCCCGVGRGRSARLVVSHLRANEDASHREYGLFNAADQLARDVDTDEQVARLGRLFGRFGRASARENAREHSSIR